MLQLKHCSEVIGWCYGLQYVYLSVNCLNDSDVKFIPVSEIILLASPSFANTIFYQVIHCQTVSLLYNRKLAVVMYNAQKWFIFNKKKYTSTNHLPWLAWYFIWNCLLLWLCLLILQACDTLLYSDFNVYIHIHPIHWLPGLQSHLFNAHMVVVLLLQCFSLQ